MKGSEGMNLQLKTALSHGDVMYSMAAIVNAVFAYSKVATRRVDLKCSQHEKKVLKLRVVMDVNRTIVIILQYIKYQVIMPYT